MTDQKNVDRKISPSFDRKGNPEWKSTMSAPDASCASIAMVPDRIIPVIFVPGVMGSNLRGIDAARGVNWRLDSAASMTGWLHRGAAARKRFLTPLTMVVDNGGLLLEGTAQQPDELRRRGWGEVGAMSYGTFLVWLENALNDYVSASHGLRQQLIGKALGAEKGEMSLTREDVALSYKYRFPVHACGYNWLDDNARSAVTLKARIEAIIARYKGEKKMCEKVIIVTHSMGGLVTRCCTEVLGMSGIVLGVVHGVMPAIGAAAVYRRFKSGTEGSHIAAKVLGEDAAEMTAVLSGAAGPMQLLPTPEYGNGWLKIKENLETVSLPKNGDPYSEIYMVRGKWWSMCEDKLIHPFNKDGDFKERQRLIDSDWTEFAKLIKGTVKHFHNQIKGRYHPNTHAFFGSHADHRSYGTVVWTGADHHDIFGRGNRKSDFLNAIPAEPLQFNTTRQVVSKLDGEGWKNIVAQTYTISVPDEPGDGTVPHRSGVAPRENPHVKSLLQVRVGHEPAYKDSELARSFTLRAIVQIASEIKKTSLSYG